MPLHPNSRLVLCHVPLAPREKGHEYPTEDPELNIMELLLWRNGTGIGGISAAPGSLAWHRGLKGLALPQLLGSLQLQLGSDPWRELHMLWSGQKRKKKKKKKICPSPNFTRSLHWECRWSLEACATQAANTRAAPSSAIPTFSSLGRSEQSRPWQVPAVSCAICQRAKV